MKYKLKPFKDMKDKLKLIEIEEENLQKLKELIILECVRHSSTWTEAASTLGMSRQGLVQYCLYKNRSESFKKGIRQWQTTKEYSRNKQADTEAAYLEAVLTCETFTAIADKLGITRQAATQYCNHPSRSQHFKKRITEWKALKKHLV